MINVYFQVMLSAEKGAVRVLWRAAVVRQKGGYGVQLLEEGFNLKPKRTENTAP